MSNPRHYQERSTIEREQYSSSIPQSSGLKIKTFIQRNRFRQDSSLRKKYGIREQPKLDKYYQVPQPAVPYKRFSPFKAGAYTNNGSSNVYLNSNVNMVEASRRVSSQEKYSKVDNSCPRSFQSKVINNVLESLVT